MKSGTLKTIALIGMLLVMTVASAQAQAGSLIVANIPFDFTAGATKLAAGEYVVKRVAKNTLLFRSVTEKRSVLIRTAAPIQQGSKDAPERLVFNRYGIEHFLAQVWTTRTGDGYLLNKSKAETQLGESKLPREAVAVLAKPR